MELCKANPFIRFAEKLRFEFQRGPSKTYDCRFLYTMDGEAVVQVEGVDYTVSRGSLVMFQPNTQYMIIPKNAVDMLVFDFDFTQDYSDTDGYLIPCPVSSYQPENAHSHISFSDAPLYDEPVYFDNVSFLESTLLEIIAEFQEKRLLFACKVSTLFKSILVDLARHSKLGSKSDTVITQIMRYIDANICGQITNGEIGAYFNYNPNYLNRLMLRHTGKTLHQYVLQQRIALSLKLIQTSDMTIKEIAMSLGFNSPSHFSYCFKKETGFSPLQFRDT